MVVVAVKEQGRNREAARSRRVTRPHAIPLRPPSQMRPSAVRLARIIPRTQLPPHATVITPVKQEAPKQNKLLEELQQRKLVAGAAYPSNVRLEPVVHKAAYKRLTKQTREELKSFVRER